MEIVRLNTRIESLQAESNDLKYQRRDLSGQGSFMAGFSNTYESTITAIENSMGTLKELGENTGRYLESALTSPFDAMLEAISRGENGLKAFGNTLGKIMQEAGAELMKFYAKQLLVYILGKLMNMWGGASVSTAGLGGAITGNTANVSLGTSSSISSIGASGFNEGGPVPANIGIPGQDSVPAVLTPGEFVVSAPAVAEYGTDFLHKINRRRFADGGVVGSAARSGKAGAGSEEQGYTINVINVVDPTSIPRTTDKEILNVIQMDAVKNGPVIRTIKGSMSK
jgi:hypothetical protein